MENINHLKRDRATAVDAAKAIAAKSDTEKRALTEEESKEFDKHVALAESLNGTIERLERAMKLAVPTEQAKAPETPEERAKHIDVHNRAEDEPFKSFGEQIRSVITSVRSGQIDPRLIQLRAQGMSESVPSDGGFLVQKDFQASIIKRMYEMGDIVARCRKFPIGAAFNGTKIPTVDETSRANGSRHGGCTSYWVNEGGSITASKPKFALIDLTLQKLASLHYLTDELIADTSILGNFTEEAAAEEIMFRTEDSIVSGSGVGQPHGIIGAPCTVSVAKETGQAAATVLYENISKMWARMWARSRRNAVWLINQDVEPQLFSMNLAIGTGGVPVFLPPGGASGSPYSSLYNRPIIPVEYCSTRGTQGDIILADLSQYYLADKGGIQSASSIHVAFTTDEQVLRFIYRVDGEPSWRSALTPKNGSETLSPFVMLDTRA